MDFKKVIMYGERSFCEQLSFVLDLNVHKIIEDLKEYDFRHKLIACNSAGVKKFARKNGLKKNIDYYDMNYIYKIINKGYIHNLTFFERKDIFNKYNIMIFFNSIRPRIRNSRIINSIPVYFLKPSEMFLRTVYSPSRNINCTNIEKECNIDSDGYLWGCCATWVRLPFGNILNDFNSYNSYLARIIKLSSINKSYCFCNIKKCKYSHDSFMEKKHFFKRLKSFPSKVTVSIDKSCNLKCPSCRKCFFNKSNDKSRIIADELISSSWLDKCDDIIVAGQGEVFYSPVYRKIILSDIKRKKIQLLTNGTLFNKKNWEMIEKLYNEIHVYVSIDAATRDTYMKMRCGNFDYLLKNLKMLSYLRSCGKIKRIEYNFVVQKDNYTEMEDFVKLSKSLNVDQINFTKLNNWGTFTKKEYDEKSLLVLDKYLDYDFYLYLKNDVFNDDIVNLEQFKDYIKRSDDYYR